MKKSKTLRLTALWKVAAAIAGLLAIGYLTLRLAGPSAENLSLAALGEIREVSLPDGSLVVLNAGGSLSWPPEFRGPQREVRLKGEAWFEVESDPSHPFIVKLEGAQVEVLGTRFNVKEDSLRGSVSVLVEEGRVAFSDAGNPGTGRHANRLVLAAGEGALMDHFGIIQAEKIDPNELSWRTGILVFDQHPLRQVADILEDYYGSVIEVDPGIGDELEFTSTIRNEELDAVLEELCLVLDLACEKAEGKILLHIAP